MRTVQVSGGRYVMRPLSEGDIAPGSLVHGKRNAQAFRILCIDGNDVVMRNMRHASLFEAVPARGMARHFALMVPEPPR